LPSWKNNIRKNAIVNVDELSFSSSLVGLIGLTASSFSMEKGPFFGASNREVSPFPSNGGEIDDDDDDDDDMF
jgi:hypothetical protein